MPLAGSMQVRSLTPKMVIHTNLQNVNINPNLDDIGYASIELKSGLGWSMLVSHPKVDVLYNRMCFYVIQKWMFRTIHFWMVMYLPNWMFQI